MPEIHTYEALAASAYPAAKTIDQDPAGFTAPPAGYLVIGVAPLNANGFQAIAYQSIETRDINIAFAETFTNEQVFGPDLSIAQSITPPAA